MVEDHCHRVTDHAVLRYMERSLGLSDFIADIRTSIAHSIEPAIAFGAPVVIIHNARLIIEDGIVVTVLPKDARGKRL